LEWCVFYDTPYSEVSKYFSDAKYPLKSADSNMGYLAGNTDEVNAAVDEVKKYDPDDGSMSPIPGDFETNDVNTQRCQARSDTVKKQRNQPRNRRKRNKRVKRLSPDKT